MMADDFFCTACRTMMATKKVPELKFDHPAAPHHPDGASFQRAVESGCRICFQVWIAFEKPIRMCGTRWIVSETSCPLTLRFLPTTPDMTAASCAKFWLEPWDEYLAGTPLSPLSKCTGSDQSFDFVRSKYEQCVRYHPACSTNATRDYTPTRLLDVGSSQQHTIRLVDRQHIPKAACYTTLSHCWGGLVPFKLTASTDSALRHGINMDRLPKSFQHAIIVTRKMQLQYLWIDSLCIYQDNINDWSIEAASMQDVYHHAIFNIAASAAPDGGVGLFYQRKPEELMRFKINVAWHLKYNGQYEDSSIVQSFMCARDLQAEDTIDDAPLNGRAWVMQERMLSRRIVHFTSGLLYWECYVTFADEVHPDGINSPRRLGSRALKQMLKEHDSAIQDDHRREQLHEAWRSFLTAYTGTRLTRRSDKLVALAGVTKKVSLLLQDECVAGLWRSQFLRELCWFVETRCESCYDQPQNLRETWVAPSWSWASIDNLMVHMDYTGYSSEVVRLVEVNVHAKPSGALVRGFLKLSCRPIPALLRIKRKQEETSVQGWWENRLLFSDTETVLDDHYGHKPKLYLDAPHIPDSLNSLKAIHLVIVQENIPVKSRYSWVINSVAGLAIVSSASEKDTFERIGFFSGDYDADRPRKSFYKTLAKKHAQAEDQIIKII